MSDGNAYRSAYAGQQRIAVDPYEKAARDKAALSNGKSSESSGTQIPPTPSAMIISALRESIIRELRDSKEKCQLSDPQKHIGYCFGIDTAIEIIFTRLRGA